MFSVRKQYTKVKNYNMKVAEMGDEMGNEWGNLRESVSQRHFRKPSSWQSKGPIYRGEDYNTRLSQQSYQGCPLK